MITAFSLYAALIFLGSLISGIILVVMYIYFLSIEFLLYGIIIMGSSLTFFLICDRKYQLWEEEEFYP